MDAMIPYYTELWAWLIEIGRLWLFIAPAFLWLASIIYCIELAAVKGRSRFLWLLFGIILGPLALLRACRKGSHSTQRGKLALLLYTAEPTVYTLTRR